MKNGMNNGLVSIIVPVYNVERYLSDCITGIAKQTYKNIEIILVDDGSTDSSGRICDDYLKIDSRITVLHQYNKGLSVARNAGIETAKGSYLCFVDSDDMVSPYMVEHLIELIRINDADLSFCCSTRCDSGIKFSEIGFGISVLNDITNYSSGEAMKALIKYKTIPVTAWGKMYRRKLFNSLRFPEGKYNEDAFISFRIIGLAKKVCGCSNIDYFYRVNRNSIMRAAFNEKRFDGIEAKLLQLSFVSDRYPALVRSAESSVVAVCNECLFDMGVANYSDSNKELFIQNQYKMYCGSYLMDNTSIKGKLFAIVSYISVRMGKAIAKRMYKYKPTR